MEAPQARFSLRHEKSLLQVHWAPSLVLHDSDGDLLTAQIVRAVPGRRVHLLMFLNGMTALSQDALSYFARRAPLSAVALVGPSVLDQPLVELYLEVYRPPFPVGYFDHGAAARAWLACQPPLEARAQRH